jgi:hypothetical protein
MLVVRKETLQGLNTQIAAIKGAGKTAGQVLFGVTQFATGVTLPSRFAPVRRLRPYTEQDYRPSGWTALYDGIGMTIDRLQQEADSAETAFLVITLTDGMENMSSVYKDGRTLAAKIKMLEATGRWTFTFIGANVDLETIRKTLQLQGGNVTTYVPDAAGTVTAFNATAAATTRYLGERALGVTTVGNFYASSTPTKTAG